MRRYMYKTCDVCKHGAFNIEIGFSKPAFRCTQCDHSWCYGYNGGPYFTNALNYKDEDNPKNWVEHVNKFGNYNIEKE